MTIFKALFTHTEMKELLGIPDEDIVETIDVYWDNIMTAWVIQCESLEPSHPEYLG